MNNKDKIILEKLIDTYGVDVIFEDMKNRTTLKHKLLAASIALGLLPGIVGTGNYYYDKEAERIEMAKDSAAKYIQKKQIENQIKKTRQEQVNAIADYMNKAINAQQKYKNPTGLTPEYILSCAQEYNYDIPLLLAQAHQESCFGITPRAQKTNSVFSVGSWDNGMNRNTYATQNESVPEYIELMQNDYLSGKSIDDVLKSGNFVNYNGHRYARDPQYESKIRYLRNKIIKEYPVLKDAHLDYTSPEFDIS